PAAVRRLRDGVTRRARRPWTRIYPQMLSDEALLRATRCSTFDALWQRQLERPFFLHVGDRDLWTRTFTSRYAAAAAHRIADAEAAMRHEFDLLGSGPTALGSRLPWHDDFKQHRTWPLAYAPDIEYLELDRPTDVK